MIDRMTTAARRSVRAAELEAMRQGAAAIESEHLLVALADDDATAQPMADHGLSRASLLELLDQERRRSLSFAGVEMDAAALARGPEVRKVRLGRSTKDALIRAVRDSARSRGIDSRALLRAVLRAETGTVPRVLALAGIDGPTLADQLS